MGTTLTYHTRHWGLHDAELAFLARTYVRAPVDRGIASAARTSVAVGLVRRIVPAYDASDGTRIARWHICGDHR